MTIDQIKREVTAAIVEAIPGICFIRTILTTIEGEKIIEERTSQPITLADVLLATMAKEKIVTESEKGGYIRVMSCFGTPVELNQCFWNLSLNLEDQKDEVWRFLHSVLNKL
jgi:hypothetical protein